MHDPRIVREQIDLLRDGMRRRGRLETHAQAIDDAERLDRERRQTIQAVEERKAARNAVTQEVAQRKRAGENADELMARSRQLGEEIARLEEELAAAQTRLDAILLEIPQLTLADVPEGGEEANTVVRTWGEPRPADEANPHWEIGARLGLLDFPRGVKVAGSGFIAWRGKGARLVRAFMQFLLDLHTREHGYEEVWVPFLANRAAMTGTSQLPKFAEDMYAVQEEDLFLIPTAEVTITNLYADEIVDADMLPKGFVGYTPCFRREAGSAGKDTRGLLRVHQFDKVELVRYATPEDSAAQHELLTSHAETVLQRLGLPYRVLLLAAGDTGFASAKTYDLEVFSPGTGKWLEVSSCSNFLDFQARRMNLRYRPGPKEKPRFVHTLNGSGLAFPRTIACLLEHGLQPDGSVLLPEALRPYYGADRIV